MSPRSQKPAVIDGLTSVRAARRARTTPKSSAAPETPNEETDGAEAPPRKDARIKRTAKPKRFDIHCYHCGYAFPIHGRLRSVACPKCREELSAEEVVIESERTRDIRTIGRIELARQGKLTDCSITANEFVLAGNAKGARKIVCNTLTIKDGARYEIKNITVQDIRVDAEARTRITRRVQCRNLEVWGRLNGNVVSDGNVVIHEGGSFKGKLGTYRLTIEDGGSMSAELDLRPRKGESK